MVEMIQPPPIDMAEVQRSIDQGLLATIAVAVDDFIVTYGNWEEENIPKWEIIGPKSEGGNRVAIYETEDTPYVWVDGGTEGPYKIPKQPKEQGFLHFKTGGTPKTQPGKFISLSGSPGTESHFAKQVEHPGIDPRDFSGQEAEELEEKGFPKTMQISINRAKTY